MSSFHRMIVAVFVILLPAHRLRAQSAPAHDDEPVCLGFAFGTWTPALNWKGAGHGEMPDAKVLPHAPAGRDWATDAGAGMSDTLMILYPAWWPAGVRVDLPTREPAVGDTVVGKATAFVANGAVKSPVAKVRAWRVECRSKG